MEKNEEKLNRGKNNKTNANRMRNRDVWGEGEGRGFLLFRAWGAGDNLVSATKFGKYK
jgi:hypothetical protein